MKKIFVLGLGKSGSSAAEWLLKDGKSVLGFDDKILPTADIEALIRWGMQLVEDPQAIDWNTIHLMVVSPGIRTDHPLYLRAKEHRVEVIGEAELALRALSQPAVAITGTNGKTTVTMLVEHILKTAGIKARSLGNIGQALSAYAMQPDLQEVLVVELSSYQIETLSSGVFDAAVILNISPDHLDRYRDMQDYAKAKCALQHCVKEKGFLFVHQSVVKEFGYLLAKPYIIYGNAFGEDWTWPQSCARWAIHDKENAYAAWALCSSYGVSSGQFKSALETFQKPPHRIEFVCEIEGVCYYDDSKGTNLDAVIQAVRAMSGPVILIAGGVDKGASYLPWKDNLKGKIKRILVLGQAAEKIEAELGSFFEIERVDSLKSAVEKARGAGVKGDVVLLSPGCSSQDMFENFLHRGQEFKRCVHNLIRERGRAS